MEFEFKNEFTLSWVGVARMFRMAEIAFMGGHVDKGQMNILGDLYRQCDDLGKQKLNNFAPHLVTEIELLIEQAKRNRKVIKFNFESNQFEQERG